LEEEFIFLKIKLLLLGEGAVEGLKGEI